MPRNLIPVVAAMLCACGSSETPLDSRFAGSWVGETETPIDGLGNFTVHDVHLTVTVSGTTGTFANYCPDGTHSLDMTGSSIQATLAANLVCPPVAVGAPLNCPSVVFTYTSAVATLVTSTTLTVNAAGTSVGCGTTYGVTSYFSGTK
jgi:hypothetical protein